MSIDEGSNVGFELFCGLVNAAPDLLVCDESKEALDLIDPGRAGWREVHMPMRPLCEPVPDRFGLVGGIVVHHQVDIQIIRDVGFYLI